jgi:hypothetical protein
MVRDNYPVSRGTLLVAIDFPADLDGQIKQDESVTVSVDRTPRVSEVPPWLNPPRRKTREDLL